MLTSTYKVVHDFCILYMSNPDPYKSRYFQSFFQSLDGMLLLLFVLKHETENSRLIYLKLTAHNMGSNHRRTLPCPTYSRWTPPESRCIFFGWEHSQIGMHNPPGFHQDSRWTPDEPHGVSGVHLPDSSVDSTWTQSRFNPPGVQVESV